MHPPLRVNRRLAGKHPVYFIFGPSAFSVATEDLLTDNGIRSQGSPGYLTVWNRRAAP